jgi:hypothetical protein
LRIPTLSSASMFTFILHSHGLPPSLLMITKRERESGHSPCVTSSLTGGCVCLSWMGFAFDRCTYPTYSLLLNIFFLLSFYRNRSYFATDGQSASMSWCRAHSETCDQILPPVGRLLSESCGLISVGRPLWREDGSAVCSVITQWSESRITRNHTLLSHLRLLQPGEPGSRIYIPQEQGGPVIPPAIGFHLRRLLRLAGLQWRYSNPPLTWRARSSYISPGRGWPSYTPGNWVLFTSPLTTRRATVKIF